MVDPATLINGIASGIGVLIAFAAFGMIGRLIPNRPFWQYPLIGWAAVYLISVIATLAGIGNLRVTLIIAAALAVISISRRPLKIQSHQIAAYLAAIAVLALSALTPPIFWDSYAHWLPNSSYLYQFHHFPEAPIANFPSLHPTYANALPLVIYIASIVTGRFAELAGNATNAVMFLIAMGCIWHLLREHWPLPTDRGEGAAAKTRAQIYVLAAIAFCIAISLNPAIEVQYYWSAIADPALAVLVLVIIVECCRYMTRDASNTDNATLLSLFLLGCLIGGLKPNAWPLAFILAVSAGFVGLVQRVPMRRWLMPALMVFIGTLFASILWKVYLKTHLPIADQFVIRPLAKWSFDLADDLLFAMLKILKTHTTYSVLVLATMAVGLLSLVRRSFIANPTLRLLVGFVSVMMALHVATLFAAYLGSGFEDWMIITASSFPRYTSQVGYAVCITGLFLAAVKCLPIAWSILSRLPPRAVAATCLLGCALVFLIDTVRPTLAYASTARDQAHRRQFALEALRTIPPGHRLAAAGSKWSVNYLRYVYWVDLDEDERPTLVDRVVFYETDRSCAMSETLAQWLRNPAIDDVLLVDADDFARRCEQNTAPDQVWRRSSGEWQTIRLARSDAD